MSAPEDARPDRWFALLLCLPALVLAWPGPGALLADVFAATELTATGAALLATLPAAALCALRRSSRRPRAVVLFFVPLVFGLLEGVGPFPTALDTLEAKRALLVLYTGLALLFAGASLRPSGHLTFLRGSVVVTLLLAVWALADEGRSRLGGVLGNTGELAAAGLFGALVGAHFLALERGAWRIVGGLATLAFLWQAAAAPAIAALASFCVCVFASALVGRHAAKQRALLAAAGVLALVAFAGFKSSSAGEELAPQAVAAEGEAAARERIFGGFGVRARIARATLPMIADHALLGVGPGQFPVQFPPYRDPAEIEASTLGRAPGFYMEVEHAHDDWLQALSEYGVLAGGALCAFWLLAGLAGLAALRRSEVTTSALGAGILALLASAATNSTLLGNPVASTLFFAAVGCLTAREVAGRSGRARALSRLLPLLVILVSLGTAWRMVGHGRALAEIQEAGTPSAATYARVLDEATSRCPDSVVAHTLVAQLLGELERPSEEVLARWNIVLELRPYRVQALLEAARRLAILGRYGEAIEHTRVVLELDPEHPGARRNLVRTLLYAGRTAEGAEELARVARSPHTPASFALDLATNLLLLGQTREAQAVFEAALPELAGLDGDRFYAEAQRREDAGDDPRVVDALRSHAQRLWARANVEAGDPASAVRVLRQNLRITREHVAPDGPTRVRMELAAALFLAGREQEARLEASRLTPSAADWAAMPSWAGEVLRDELSN